MKRYLDIDYLKSTEAIPHWFGLGFIQLKLSPTERMHFWHESLEGELSNEELHDHRYSFTSTVLHGTIFNHMWSFTPFHDGNYRRVAVSCDPNQPAPSNVEPKGFITSLASIAMPTGTIYRFDADTFHEIKARRAITLVQRPEVASKPFAHVLLPHNASRVCPFSYPKPIDQLWEMIADLLNEAQPKPGYHLKHIEKGELGEASKIREEVEEFLDSVNQGVEIMALVELSDLIGAVEAYLRAKHPNLHVSDLQAMAEVTKRAFENGRRN